MPGLRAIAFGDARTRLGWTEMKFNQFNQSDEGWRFENDEGGAWKLFNSMHAHVLTCTGGVGLEPPVRGWTFPGDFFATGLVLERLIGSDNGHAAKADWRAKAQLFCYLMKAKRYKDINLLSQSMVFQMQEPTPNMKRVAKRAGVEL